MVSNWLRYLLVRAQSLFAPDESDGLPWADPLETALDLHDLAVGRILHALRARLQWR